MRAVMLAFRAEAEFASQVDQLARATGVSRSDYVRQAVEEKNARTLAGRIAFLSQALAEQHRQFNDALDNASGDGLADR